MTTSPFTITPTPPTSVKLLPDKAGKYPESKFSFTVTSLAAPDTVEDVILQARLVGADGKDKSVDWLFPGPQDTLKMTGGKTETITITVRPTASTPKGENSIKLIVADKVRPNDVFTESPPVTCEVAPPQVKPPTGGLPKWLLPVIIAGGVVLIGGVVLLVLKLSGGKPHLPGVGETCGTGAAAACDTGLICKTDVNKCLLAGGQTCKPEQAAQCASGECAGKGVCAVPLGAKCDPGSKDTVPCLQNSTCDPGTTTCLGNAGAACKDSTECATGLCQGSVCTPKAAPLKPGDPCTGACPDPLRCSTTTKRCVEANGRTCDNNNQCDSGLCEQHVCLVPQLSRNCTADGICGPEQRCLEAQPGRKLCVGQPGHTCRSDEECSSRWCNSGVCSRDDGKCNDQSECRAPYLCITARKQCFKPPNAQCGGDSECESLFCNSNRCFPSPCPACQAGFSCNNKTAKCVSNRVIVTGTVFRFDVPKATITPKTTTTPSKLEIPKSR